MNVQSKELSFEGQSIYIGIDVHKKSWKVSIMVDDVFFQTFSQSPCVSALLSYLGNRFPSMLQSKQNFEKVKKSILLHRDTQEETSSAGGQLVSNKYHGKTHKSLGIMNQYDPFIFIRCGFLYG